MSSSSSNNNNANGAGNQNNNNSRRLHRVQKVAPESSWRACLKRKRQLEAAPSSSSQSPAGASSNSTQQTQLDHLPLNTLVIVASQLPFADFKNVGMLSKKFNTAQRTTRYSRKRVSVDLLRKLFPEEVPIDGSRLTAAPVGNAPSNSSNSANDHHEEHIEEPVQIDKSETRDDCVSMLQVLRPLRQHLRSSPSRNFHEVDFSEFSTFRESLFVDLFRTVNNGRELFAEVRRLNVQKCVIELKDMEFLAQLMPKVWFIRCSAHTLVIPEGTEQHKMTLSAEQMRQLRAKVENFVYLSKTCSKKHLWFIAQLTELFAELEVVQLDY